MEKIRDPSESGNGEERSFPLPCERVYQSLPSVTERYFDPRFFVPILAKKFSSAGYLAGHQCVLFHSNRWAIGCLSLVTNSLVLSGLVSYRSLLLIRCWEKTRRSKRLIFVSIIGLADLTIRSLENSKKVVRLLQRHHSYVASPVKMLLAMQYCLAWMAHLLRLMKSWSRILTSSGKKWVLIADCVRISFWLPNSSSHGRTVTLQSSCHHLEHLKPRKII